MNYIKHHSIKNYQKSINQKSIKLQTGAQKIIQAKKLIFNFITLNALMFAISLLATACAGNQQTSTPTIDNNQQVQNTGKQPSISLAQTAEASETTEDMRTPSASSTNTPSQSQQLVQSQGRAASKTANTKTQTTAQALTQNPTQTATQNPTQTPNAEPVGSIQKTEKQPTVTERLHATLKAPAKTIHGTTILEETAQGTYIHINAKGLDPKSSYNLSLYEKGDCATAQLGNTPQAPPEKVLAKLPMSKKGNVKFSQFFEGLKVNGESGLRSKSIIITENLAKNSSQTLENSKATAACAVLSN